MILVTAWTQPKAAIADSPPSSLASIYISRR